MFVYSQGNIFITRSVLLLSTSLRVTLNSTLVCNVLHCDGFTRLNNPLTE